MIVQYYEPKKAVSTKRANFLSSQFASIQKIILSISSELDKRGKKLFHSLSSKWRANNKTEIPLKQCNIRLLQVKKLLQHFLQRSLSDEHKQKQLISKCEEIEKQLTQIINSKIDQALFAQKNTILHPTLQFVFYNPKMLCGSHFFVKGVKVIESQLEHHLIKLNKCNLSLKNSEVNQSEGDHFKQNKKDLILERLLCAGLNGRHTYITVGICKDNIIRGEIFNESEKKLVESKINQASRKIQPNNFNKIRTKFIPVYLANINDKKIEKTYEKGLFVLLIELKEERERKFYYIMQKKEKLQIEEQAIIRIKGERLYKKIQRAAIKKKCTRTHDGCVQPEIGNILLETKMIKKKKSRIFFTNTHIILFLSYQLIRKSNIQINLSKH